MLKIISMAESFSPWYPLKGTPTRHRLQTAKVLQHQTLILQWESEVREYREMPPAKFFRPNQTQVVFYTLLYHFEKRTNKAALRYSLGVSNFFIIAISTFTLWFLSQTRLIIFCRHGRCCTLSVLGLTLPLDNLNTWGRGPNFLVVS